MLFKGSTDVEPVPFNRGFYSIDLKYFFRITLSVYTGVGRPTEVEGLATFDKKVILFGSEGNAKIFKSKYKEDAFDPQLWRKTNMPSAVVETGGYKRKIPRKFPGILTFCFTASEASSTVCCKYP